MENLLESIQERLILGESDSSHSTFPITSRELPMSWGILILGGLLAAGIIVAVLMAFSADHRRNEK